MLKANLNSVDDWVEYIQTLHFREMDLSLERVAQVYQRLYPQGVNFKVISISGTNGKGSTAELLSSIYHTADYRVGKYTSPHLVSFNERIQMDRQAVDDESLLLSFERIENARGDIRLTFFEFGTLLAIDIFAQNNIDLAIMEVGLGGRLDAVNILDADVAIVTNISIDHSQWLGDSVEQIGAEKIAISRTNKPCIVGMVNPPASLMQYCSDKAVELYQINKDFDYQLDNDHWSWQTSEQKLTKLPLPYQQTGVQLSNASLALMACYCLSELFPISDVQYQRGIANAQLMGRCQRVSEQPLIVFDVSHNVASVKALRDFINQYYTKNKGAKLYAVCGMLQDKQIEQSLACLVDLVDEWHFATIDNSRGSTAAQIEQILKGLIDRKQPRTGHSYCYDSAIQAYTGVANILSKDDALLVFGSFYLVGDIIHLFGDKIPLKHNS